MATARGCDADDRGASRSGSHCPPVRRPRTCGRSCGAPAAARTRGPHHRCVRPDRVGGRSRWHVAVSDPGRGLRANVLARMGSIGRDADNAAAAAYRQGELRTVPAHDSLPGAIVAPIITGDGCVGVLAAEMRHGAERDEATQAIAAILAAQLATFVTAVPVGQDAESVNTRLLAPGLGSAVHCASCIARVRSAPHSSSAHDAPVSRSPSRFLVPHVGDRQVRALVGPAHGAHQIRRRGDRRIAERGDDVSRFQTSLRGGRVRRRRWSPGRPCPSRRTLRAAA